MVNLNPSKTVTNFWFSNLKSQNLIIYFKNRLRKCCTNGSSTVYLRPLGRISTRLLTVLLVPTDSSCIDKIDLVKFYNRCHTGCSFLNALYRTNTLIKILLRSTFDLRSDSLLGHIEFTRSTIWGLVYLY